MVILAIKLNNNWKDTDNNSDLFFKDVTDGVNVITVGTLDSI